MYAAIKNNVEEHLKANEALEQNGQWRKALFHLIIAAEELAKALVMVFVRSPALKKIPVKKDELNEGIKHLEDIDLKKHDFKLFLFIVATKFYKDAEQKESEIAEIIARCDQDIIENPGKELEILAAGLVQYIQSDMTSDLFHQAKGMAREWNNIKKACIYIDDENIIGREISDDEYTSLKNRIMPIIIDMLEAADLILNKNPKGEVLLEHVVDRMMEKGDFIEQIKEFESAASKRK